MPELSLEPLEVRHAAELFELLQDSRLYTYIPEEPPALLSKLEERYRFLEGRRSPDGSEHWLNWVMRLDTGEPVGTLQATVEADGTTYAAYMVFPDRWRKGYAKAGMRLMIELLQRDFGVTRLVAHLDTRNVASRRLLESLGFARTGFIEGADEFKGEVSDEYVYSLDAVHACAASERP